MIQKDILRAFLNGLIFLSGIAILIWQIHGTFNTFIVNRTGFAVSVETSESLVPPTIILCPKTSIKIKEKVNLSIQKPEDEVGVENYLNFGKNFNDDGQLIFTVKELTNQPIGLCYAIIPDQSFKMEIQDYLILRATFEPIVKEASVYFTSQEDHYGMLFNDLGRLMPFGITTKSGCVVGAALKRIVWKEMSSNKKNCKKEEKEEKSVWECILKNQVDCFRFGNQSCKCIPGNLYKTQFEMNPINWNNCTTDSEVLCAIINMNACYFNKKATMGCLLPCKKELYKGITIDINNWDYPPPLDQSTMTLAMKYNSMDTEIHEEYKIQDIYSFIGTVGGSFGLFIGFSYTDFVGKVLDYLISRHD